MTLLSTGGGSYGGKLLCITALGIGLSIFAPVPAGGATLSTNAAWTWMKGANSTNQNGTCGTQGVPAPTNTPGARYSAVSWTDGTGALFDLPSTAVLSGLLLSPGTYYFWFAVDYPMDGILNVDGPILYDQVTVTVQ